MTVNITPAKLSGTIRAVPSKSDAHRLFICASLGDRPAKLICREPSKDILATADCLRSAWCDIEEQSGIYSIMPRGGKMTESSFAAEKPVYMNCGESGSTLRFLMPLSAVFLKTCIFTGEGRLPQRPVSPLREEMERHGCSILAPADASLPMRISGRLEPGNYEIPGNVSSQFISGLLMALPLLAGDSILTVTGKVESMPYIQMTLRTLCRFGIKIGEEETADGLRFRIPGGQSCHTPEEALEAEGDWSSAAFWITAGFLGGEILYTGLKENSAQGDRAVRKILEEAGARVTIDHGCLRVAGGRRNSFTVDAAEIPDLVPILAVAASVCDGVSVIRGAGRLRIKESDRLTATADCLNRLGADVQEQAEGLIIRGRRMLKGGCVDCYRDHRIAMAMAIAAMVCEAPVRITGAEAVEKSYPGFFRDFQSLGGVYHVV